MNSRPKLLDLFCGAGGAAVGYHRAGFDVVGVDIEPQPHYPFAFVRADAISYAGAHGWEFDAIHASPPCQTHSSITKTAGTQSNHEDFIPQTRWILRSIGLPYIIENVPGAEKALKNPVVVCGTALGCLVVRHRLFESNVLLFGTHCQHERPVVKHGRRPNRETQYAAVTGHFSDIEFARTAMGIEWMTQHELAQAIPPAYTEYIGRQLLRCVQRQAVSA